MKTEPKPATGEWTVEKVQGTLDAHGHDGIVRAHNAALAAEREEHAKALLAKQTRIEIFQEQLAAEQQKYAALRRGKSIKKYQKPPQDSVRFVADKTVLPSKRDFR